MIFAERIFMQERLFTTGAARFRAALIAQCLLLFPFFLSMVCRILLPSRADVAAVRFFLNHKMGFLCVLLLFALLDAAYLKRAWIVRHKEEIGAIAGMTFLSTLLLFMPGVSKGHDLPFHLTRIEGMVDAIKGGQFPVRLQPLWFDGYGYPVSIYYGDLLLYFPVLLRLFNVPLGAAYELYVFFVTALAAFTSYVCFSRIAGSKTAGILSALSYTSSTYRIMDIFTRSAVGEYTAFIFFPVIALAVFRIYTEHGTSLANAALLAFGMSALLLTHLLSSELVAAMLLIVCIVLWKKTFSKRVMPALLLAAGLTVLFCAAFLVPFIDYAKNVPVLVQDPDVVRFKRIQERGVYIVQLFAFFAHPQGAHFGINNRMQYTPGMLLMGAFVMSAAFLVYRKKDRPLLLFWVLSLVTLYFATNLFPYDALEETTVGMLLAQLQLPCRWLTISTVFLTLTFGRLFVVWQESTPPRPSRALTKRAVCAGIVFLAALQTTYFASAFLRGSENYVVNDYRAFGTAPTHGNEYIRIGTDPAKRDGKVAASGVSVLSSKRRGTTFTADARSENGGFMDIPLFNYKGYRATAGDGTRLALSDGENNRVRVHVPASFSGTVTVAFVPPLLWRISEMISLASVAGTVVLLVLRGKAERTKRDGSA